MSKMQEGELGIFDPNVGEVFSFTNALDNDSEFYSVVEEYLNTKSKRIVRITGTEIPIR